MTTWHDRVYRSNRSSVAPVHMLRAISSKPPSDEGLYENQRAYAEVSYQEPLELPNWGTVTTRAHDPAVGYYRDQEMYQPTAGAEHRDQLFRQQPGKVSGAFADPSMQGHIPTLLGLAGNLSRQLTGQLPMADKSLSVHSAPMVQKLISRGAKLPVNPENPNAAVTNNITKAKTGRMLLSDWDERGDPIPDEQVRAGRETMRNFLRPPKKQMEVSHPAVSRAQFSQGTLF